ncbi:MAG: hypothetical protein H6726_12705 [Sandaracinaceae bacterium]|nr:hypothetical protein [Sandaracinaceae bacterium]
MLVTSRPRSARSRATLCGSLGLLVVASSLVACGGAPSAALTRGTLPTAETSLLDLVPRDAFFAGRLDVGALRGTPHWDAILAQLQREDQAIAELAADTGHMYFAVGGLVPVPAPPPPYDAEGNYRSAPPWADLARSLHGRLPKLVAIADGGAARACRLASEGLDGTERRGFRVVDMNGVALVMRGDSFCAMTWTPLVDALLEESGPTADIAEHLVAGPGGIARMALRLDSPAVAEMLADVTFDPAASEAEVEIPEGFSDEDAERYRADMQENAARQQRMANFSRAVLRLVTHGLTGVSWQIRSEGDGFETRTQVVTSDEGRMAMWRELTEIHFDVLRALVSYRIAREGHPFLVEFVRDVRIEEQRGGYQIVRHTRHEVIARMLEAAVPEPIESFARAVEDPEGRAEAELRMMLAEGPRDSAQSVIESIEPHLDFVRAQPDPYFRGDMLTTLARAYAVLGRFDDARALLEADRARLVSPPSEQEQYRDHQARDWIANYSALLCELHLAQGNAERALEAVSEAEHPEHVFLVRSCGAAALALLGREEEALTRLDADTTPSLPDYGVARVRVLLFAGQTAEALSVMRALCMGRAGNPVCQPYAVHFADALASSASSLESAEPSLGALRGRYTRGSGDFEADTRAARIVAADCALRARLAATAEATREVCAQALAETVAVHGETHPDVAVVRTAFATALQAGRQRAEATAQREAAAPIIETLGPQHPLRARPRRGR